MEGKMVLLFLIFSVWADVQTFEAKTVYCFESKKLSKREDYPTDLQLNWVLQKKDGFLYEYVQSPKCHFFNNVTFNSYFPQINSTLFIRGCSQKVNVPNFGDISLSPKLTDFEEINHEMIAKKIGKNCFLIFQHTQNVNDYRRPQRKHTLVPDHLMPLRIEK
jgi:hypothetical protein